MAEPGPLVLPPSGRPRSLAASGLRSQQRRFALGINVLGALGFAAACVDVARGEVTWLDVLLMISLYSFSILGVTAGFHRLFAHRAYETRPAIRALLAIAGSTAGQGPLTYWVALHRMHHQFSDSPGDPHSPNCHGASLAGRLGGLAHAHLGWVVDGDVPSTSKYAKDLLQDRLISGMSRLFTLWLCAGLLVPALIAGLATHSLAGAFHGFVWGGLARVFLGIHATSAVNSICHLLGARRFDTRDRSTNVALLSLPTFGESWHNNHHAFPRSAVFGLRPWELDIGGLFIRSLDRLGLAASAHEPDAAAIESRLRSDRPLLTAPQAPPDGPSR